MGAVILPNRGRFPEEAHKNTEKPLASSGAIATVCCAGCHSCDGTFG